MSTELEKANEFMRNHNCPLANSAEAKKAVKHEWALDGRFDLEMASCSIGTKLVVTCECGQKCDVTDYELW